MRIFFLSVLAGAVALAVYLYFYLGAYKSVETSIAVEGPFYLIYKTHIGPYHQIGSIIQQAEAFATSQNLACSRTFGEFLDDPEALDEDRLRSHAGCILNGPPTGPTGDFVFELRPARRYAVAHFNGSPSIGPFKVYPKVEKFLAEQRQSLKRPNLEIYLVNGNKVDTEYLFPLDAPTP